MQKLLKYFVVLLSVMTVQLAFAQNTQSQKMSLPAEVKMRSDMLMMLSNCPKEVIDVMPGKEIEGIAYPEKVSWYIYAVRNALRTSTSFEVKVNEQCRQSILKFGEYLVRERYVVDKTKLSAIELGFEQLKIQPDYLLAELYFAYGEGALNSIDIQKEYFTKGEFFLEKLKELPQVSSCLIDSLVFNTYLSVKNPQFSSEEVWENDTARRYDALERVIRSGERANKCSQPFPSIAFTSARWIGAQSELLVLHVLWGDIPKEEVQKQRDLIKPQVSKWIQAYFEPLDCKAAIRMDALPEYENDLQYFLQSETWLTCSGMYREELSRNYIFDHDLESNRRYEKLIVNDSKTNVLEFSQDCKNLLKITPASFGEKENYKEFRILIEPVCQKHEINSRTELTQ